MPHFRTPGPNSKWYLPKYKFRTVANFCLQYPELISRREILENGGIKGVKYDGMPHGSGTGDPTALHAMELDNVTRKIDIIEGTCKEVAMELAPWMLMAITDDKMTYDKLRWIHGMPISMTDYIVLRRKLYWTIAQKI